jgi:ubiquitin-protein ligase
VKCLTQLWHPNISEQGDICLSILRQNSGRLSNISAPELIDKMFRSTFQPFRANNNRQNVPVNFPTFPRQ